MRKCAKTHVQVPRNDDESRHDEEYAKPVAQQPSVPKRNPCALGPSKQERFLALEPPGNELRCLFKDDSRRNAGGHNRGSFVRADMIHPNAGNTHKSKVGVSKVESAERTNRRS